MAASPKRLSKNQRVVLDALQDDGRPMSAYQILDLERVRGEGVRAPLTVYRALDKLIENGLVHRIESLNAFVVCDHEPHAEPAVFMICLACKRTIEVGMQSLQKAVLRQAAENDFEVEHMHVEVSGRCAKCVG